MGIPFHFLKRNNNLGKFLNIATELVDDQTASLVPFLYPEMEQIEVNPKARSIVPVIAAGTRINWYGNIMRAIVDIEDIIDNNPDNAPILWEEIKYKNGYRIIDGEKVFALNECGWFNNSIYRSKIDNNLTNPELDSENWEVI